MNLAAIAHVAIGIVVARFTNQSGAGLRITALSANSSWHGGAGYLAAILLLAILVPEISLADVGAASVHSGARRTVGSREALACLLTTVAGNAISVVSVPVALHF